MRASHEPQQHHRPRRWGAVRRLPTVTLSTVMLVAAPTVLSSLPTAPSTHDRPGSTATVALAGLDSRGRAEPGALNPAPSDSAVRRSVAGPSAVADRQATTAITPAVPVVGEVAVVGASWPGSLPSGATLQLRTRSGSTWGAWQALDADGEHGPDETGIGAAEAQHARGGTEPFVVTDADAVQVRVDGAPPAKDTKVEVIDPGQRTEDSTVGTSRPDAAQAATARPTIHSRKSWGADESLRKGSPEYGSVYAAFVHHTAGENGYSAAQVPAIIRGIYKFHVQGRGWNDIGYNFLVDRFGRIWEGRYGGINLPVVGAHTKGYNSLTFAMSAIGNFDVARPPAAMVDAYSRLFAWKMSLHGIPATGWLTLHGKWFQRISGHRDAGQTACPGRYLYAKLPTIRAATASRLGGYPRRDVTRSLDGGGTPDLVALPTATAPAATLAEARAPVAGRRDVGTDWQSMSLVTVSADLTGDDQPDIVARDAAGRLRVYSGDGAGHVTGRLINGSGWSSISRLVAPGDVDGDDRADLIGVSSSGRLWLYPGDGHGWLTPKRQIGSGWNSMSALAAVGDLTGDGTPDLLGVRASDGLLMRYAGDGAGGFGQRTVIGSGWTAFDTLLGAGDLDGDGQVDVLARERKSGRMRTYYGTPSGGLSPRLMWGTGFGAMPALTSGVDWDGDGHPDLLGVRPTGDLVAYGGTGRREFNALATSGLQIDGTDLAFVVGDLDGDGRSDVLARRADTGALYLYDEPGVGSTPSSDRRVGTGWDIMNLIAPAGDLDGDGVPDVLARDAATGSLWIYPMRASGAFGTRRLLGTGWGSVRGIVGVGTWDDDGAADVVALMSDGRLRLYLGNGPGRLASGRYLTTSSTGAVALIGAGDVDGDGRTDILARAADGGLLSFSRSGQSVGAARSLVTDPLAAARDLG